MRSVTLAELAGALRARLLRLMHGLLLATLCSTPALAVPWSVELVAPDAHKVYLAGEMTGWDSNKRPMERDKEGRWHLTMDLPAGQWLYKFVVDDKWIADPNNPLSDSDGLGGRHSFVLLGNGDWQVPAGAARGQVVTVEAPSMAWGAPSRYHVYLPAGYSGGRPLPMLLLLHGRGMDADQWLKTGLIDRHMDALIAAKRIRPFIVVMPSSGNVPYTGQSEQFVMNELLPALKQTYGVSLSSKDTAVAGMSMGGFGAFHLGMRPANPFGLVYAMSAPFAPEYLASLGDSIKLPFQLQLSCGAEDALVDNSHELAGLLKANGARFHYQQSPGGHDWHYWNGQTSRMLTQVSAFFGGETLASNSDALRYAKPALPAKLDAVRTAVPLTIDTVSLLEGRWRGKWRLSDGSASGRLVIEIKQADIAKVRGVFHWYVPGTSKFENVLFESAPVFREGYLELPDVASGTVGAKDPGLRIKLVRRAPGGEVSA